MFYAEGPGGEKVRAVPDGQGICPGCRLSLIPKCGEIVSWHWAHRAGDCDPWYEPESEWHLSWKRLVPPERCEVTMGNHRADILGWNGIVIELQHSSLSAAAARDREEFYGCRGGMIWLFDARDYEKNIIFREGKRKGRPEYRSFRWKWGRKTQVMLEFPIFWDVGDPIWLFEVKKLSDDYRVGGWGFWMKRETFIRMYLEDKRMADPTVLSDDWITDAEAAQRRWEKRTDGQRNAGQVIPAEAAEDPFTRRLAGTDSPAGIPDHRPGAAQQGGDGEGSSGEGDDPLEPILPGTGPEDAGSDAPDIRGAEGGIDGAGGEPAALLDGGDVGDSSGQAGRVRRYYRGPDAGTTGSGWSPLTRKYRRLRECARWLDENLEHSQLEARQERYAEMVIEFGLWSEDHSRTELRLSRLLRLARRANWQTIEVRGGVWVGGTEDGWRLFDQRGKQAEKDAASRLLMEAI